MQDHADTRGIASALLPRPLASGHDLREFLLHAPPPGRLSASLDPLFKSLLSPPASKTDDTLPFRTSLMAEYALLVADAPLGLAMKEEDVRRIAAWGVEGRFDGW